jgi:hypothetical protein
MAPECQSFLDNVVAQRHLKRRIAAVDHSRETGSIATACLARSSSPLSPTTHSRANGNFPSPCEKAPNARAQACRVWSLENAFRERGAVLAPLSLPAKFRFPETETAVPEQRLRLLWIESVSKPFSEAVPPERAVREPAGPGSKSQAFLLCQRPAQDA